MRLKSLLFFLTLFSATCLIQSCSNETTTSISTNTNEVTIPENATLAETTTIPTIAPPLKGVDVAFNTFQVSPQQAKTIEMPNGTSIEIPANAFVDASGNPVTDEVAIQYREFHNAAEIMASGIPMKAKDKNGEEGWMQTAGMFEMNGTAKGQPVFIAPDKAVQVNMASNVPGEYDFWKFNEAKGDWDNLGTNTPEVNNKRSMAKAQLVKLEKTLPIKPVEPVKFNQKKAVLNFNINYDAFPELQQMTGIVWQYSGSDMRLDPLKNEWIFDEQWDYVDLKPATSPNQYKMELSKSDKKFIMDVTPSQKGEAFEEAMASYQENLDNYKKVNFSVEAQREVFKAQAEFIRSFSVAGFGIHNYDIIIKMPAAIPILANFDFGPGTEHIKKMVPVYLITGEGRAVAAFPFSDWHKFVFDAEADNRLVAVLPGNKVAVFTQSDFRQHADALRNARNNDYTFKMNILDKSVGTIADVMTILNQIA